MFSPWRWPRLPTALNHSLTHSLTHSLQISVDILARRTLDIVHPCMVNADTDVKPTRWTPPPKYFQWSRRLAGDHRVLFGYTSRISCRKTTWYCQKKYNHSLKTTEPPKFLTQYDLNQVWNFPPGDIFSHFWGVLYSITVGTWLVGVSTHLKGLELQAIAIS